MGESSGMRPLTRGDNDAAALLENLVELSRKPNQNRVLDTILKALLEAAARRDHVSLPVGFG